MNNFVKRSGKICINSSKVSLEKKIVTITVQDESSRLIALEIELDLNDFALAAIHHQNDVICSYQINNSKEIGKTHENETVILTVRGNSHPENEFVKNVKSASKEFEIDGWEVDDYCLKSFNQHNVVEYIYSKEEKFGSPVGFKYKVIRRRYV